MLESGYRYVLELFKEDGAWLGRVSAEADWIPALEWTRLWALRRGLLPREALAATASLEPVWDAEAGEPHLAGFQVAIAAAGREARCSFATAYFRTLAEQASRHFVEQGLLCEGEIFRFAVAAYRRFPPSDNGGGAVELPPPLSIHPASLEAYLRRAAPVGVIDAQDYPVFLPAALLKELEELTRAHAGFETGGVLIGRLLHDPAAPELFAELAAQIPLRGQGEPTRLSFTPERWTEIQAALALRRREETCLGYWHSHPVAAWCREKGRQCCPERLPACALAEGYFSGEDRALLRAVFPRAYSLGLVVNDQPLGRLTFSLFGWRRGLIQPRGYYVLEGDENAELSPRSAD